MNGESKYGPIALTPIGIIHSCFKEKFGIPRQARLAPDARAILELHPPFDNPEAVRGLEAYSHLWLIFIFHAHNPQSNKTTVRPPRLGGNQRLGVFATRSMFRPNPIGLSAVALETIRAEDGRMHLHLAGVDLLDGTPVLDIKPYLPYADYIPQAKADFADTAPEPIFAVTFTPQAEAQCINYEQAGYPQLRQLIKQVLALDPRPAYYAQRPQKVSFGMKLLDFDVEWEVRDGTIIVQGLKEL